MLKEKMPKVLAIQLSIIWLWEHHMYQWMEAYQFGLGTSEAQLQIKQFGSHKYQSYRSIPDMVASTLDTASSARFTFSASNFIQLSSSFSASLVSIVLTNLVPNPIN
jgi:hypothetical protein